MSRIWFITGAGRGIGRAIATAALERGDRVAATARDVAALDDLAAEHGDRIAPLRLDVTDRDAVFAAARLAVDRFGGVDVVVNNAGYGLFGTVEEITPDQLRDQLEVNLLGVLHVTQALLPTLRAQGSGHVVQISSSSGVAAWPGLGGYHASKWALEGLSDALAQEVAGFGIRVTIVEPGPVATDWNTASAVRANPLPAYDELRSNIWHPPGATEPAAVAGVVLAVVDAEDPPRRILVGDLAADAVLAATEQRLAEWRRWEELGRSADRSEHAHPVSPPSPPSYETIDVIPDIRLVVADMDGTLLDADGSVPDGFWPLVTLMRERGILFAPASGRQYATLARTFHGELDGMPIIAENGTYVVRDGVELSSVTLEPQVAADVVRTVRRLAAAGRNVGAVVCGKRSAYVDRADAAFWGEATRYYAALDMVADLAPVADLESVDDEILKVAVFDFDGVEAAVAPALAPLGRRTGNLAAQVVVSGHHWLDVMAAGVTKGDAVRRLQAELGITPAHTAAFGDYLNDLELLDAAEWSFAMVGAHPRVLEHARYTAPSHAEHGVVTVLERLLGVRS